MSLAEKLAAFVQGLPDFEFHAIDFGYNGHMGAIIIDGILQSGISYDTVVRPRVEKIRADFPSQTTSEFLAFIAANSLAEYLQFRGQKIERIQAVTEFLAKEGVETGDDFATWLAVNANEARFKAIKRAFEKSVWLEWL